MFRYAFEALGRALARWVDLFQPGVVVFGGGMSGAWDLIEPAAREGLITAGVPVVPRLVRAASAHDAPLLGAAWHAAAVSSAR